MSTKLPLLTKILYTLKLVIRVEMTKASSWERCNLLRSSLVKVMGWWVPTGKVVNFFLGSSTSTSDVSLPGWAKASSWSKPTMDHLYIACHGSVVSIPPIRRVGLWAISNILLQIPPLNYVSYLFFYLEIILNIVPVVSMKFIIFIFVFLIRVGLYFLGPLYEFFVLNLCDHLGDGNVKGR